MTPIKHTLDYFKLGQGERDQPAYRKNEPLPVVGQTDTDRSPPSGLDPFSPIFDKPVLVDLGRAPHLLRGRRAINPALQLWFVIFRVSTPRVAGEER